MSTMNYSSSDGEDEVRKPVVVKSKTSDRGNAVNKSGGGIGPMVLGAGIVGVVGIVVGVGARFLLKSRKNASSGKITSHAGKGARMVPGPRKVPPRRPRSVASSVDGSQSKRYGMDDDALGHFYPGVELTGYDFHEIMDTVLHSSLASLMIAIEILIIISNNSTSSIV